MAGLEYVITTINDVSKIVMQKYNSTTNFIKINENKNGSVSIWITEITNESTSKMAFNVSQRGRKDNKNISFNVKKDLLSALNVPESAEIKEISNDTTNVRIDFPVGFKDYYKLIEQLLLTSIDSFEPSQKFGCCDKYKECSQAGKCIHNNQFYSKACWYRKNLESGKIFY